MHVALIIDQERLAHEQSMLNRLCIGLMAEGVQLTRIVPDQIAAAMVDEGEQRIALAPRIEVPMSVLPWMRSARAARLAEALEKSVPDVLYAVGAGAWPVGVQLSEAIDRPIVIDVCSMAAVDSISSMRGRSDANIARYVAPSRPIEQLLSAKVDPSLVSLVPVGIALPPSVRQILANPAQAVGFAVLGQARDITAYDTVLRALERIVQQRSNVQIFLELRGPHEHDVWRRAERSDLLPFVSAIADAPVYRALITRCDLMLMPESADEVRSLVLESMALGMPIIGSSAPAMDLLIDGETALFASRASVDDWVRSIQGLLERPEAARALGSRARQAVSKSNRSSDQVAALIHTLDEAASTVRLRLNRPSPLAPMPPSSSV